MTKFVGSSLYEPLLYQHLACWIPITSLECIFELEDPVYVKRGSSNKILVLRRSLLRLEYVSNRQQ
jgi:hypothetical protein